MASLDLYRSSSTLWAEALRCLVPALWLAWAWRPQRPPQARNGGPLLLGLALIGSSCSPQLGRTRLSQLVMQDGSHPVLLGLILIWLGTLLLPALLALALQPGRPAISARPAAPIWIRPGAWSLLVLLLGIPGAQLNFWFSLMFALE